METGKKCQRCVLKEMFCLEGYYMLKPIYSKTETFNTINQEGLCRECEKYLAIESYNKLNN